MLLQSTINVLLQGKHERKECDVTSITESTTIKCSQWCSHPLRNADLYTSCAILIGGCCILMPILVVIILHCLAAGDAALSRAGRAWRIGSDEVLARVDYFLDAGNKQP